MKKIYLDWNVLNHLLDEELNDFILNKQSRFVYVYSPAHFSHNPGNSTMSRLRSQLWIVMRGSELR